MRSATPAATIKELPVEGVIHDQAAVARGGQFLPAGPREAAAGVLQDLDDFRVGVEGRPIQTGQLAVLGPGNTLTASALPVQESRSPNLDLLILGGRPIGEPVAWMGPFVMNTREEVMKAFADYQAGRLGTIPAITAVHNTPTTVVETGRPTDGETA